VIVHDIVVGVVVGVVVGGAGGGGGTISIYSIYNVPGFKFLLFVTQGLQTIIEFHRSTPYVIPGA
jgi:hypothetical protein